MHVVVGVQHVLAIGHDAETLKGLVVMLFDGHDSDRNCSRKKGSVNDSQRLSAGRRRQLSTR